MKRLHLLLSSAASAVSDCCDQCADVDHILLVDQGVALVTKPELLGRLREACGATISVAAVDAGARGLRPATDRAGLEWADDSDWVALVAEHLVVLSWS